MERAVGLPDRIETETELDELLSRPSPELIAFMRRLEGDLVILGIAGKMGITLGLLAARALAAAGVRKRVYGVSRFSEAGAETQLREGGVEPVRCDLLDRAAVDGLPLAPNVIYLAGRKFGTAGREELTWASNTVLPANACERYRGSRIVALSTGCVYPLVPTAGPGADEATPPAPVGEYAQSCLGRERVFEYYSRRDRTPVCLIRLNYAVELRYGVLHDLATGILRGEPVARSVPSFNAIWQGDANERILRSLELCAAPPAILNLTGPGTVDVTATAETLGGLMQKSVCFSGAPGARAYLSDARRSLELFGPPRVALYRALPWVAHWVTRGGRSLGKPTHFEVSDGRY